MIPQIVKQKWVEIDGPEGTEWLPLDLWGKEEIKMMMAEIAAENTNNKLATKMLEMTRNRTFYESKIVEGYGARLSAPGYMDCTDWCVFDTEEEARTYIEETFEVCSHCGGQHTIEGNLCIHCGVKYLT